MTDPAQRARPAEIDTAEIRRQVSKYNNLGAADILDLCDALDAARARITDLDKRLSRETLSNINAGNEAVKHYNRAETAEQAVQRVRRLAQHAINSERLHAAKYHTAFAEAVLAALDGNTRD